MKAALYSLTLLLLVGGCARKPSRVKDMGAPGLDIPDPAQVSLQAVAVSPSRVAVMTPTKAQAIGSGFQAGGSIFVGTTDVGGVRFVDSNTLSFTIPALVAGIYDVTVQNPDSRSSTIRSAVTVGGGAVAVNCPTVQVFFALDSSTLDNAARAELTSQLGCYSAGNGSLRAEGHADERGTTDYNLALGQRRAESVASHLANNGISQSRMIILSYGEERPADRGHSEAAWSRNRRVDLTAL